MHTHILSRTSILNSRLLQKSFQTASHRILYIGSSPSVVQFFTLNPIPLKSSKHLRTHSLAFILPLWNFALPLSRLHPSLSLQNRMSVPVPRKSNSPWGLKSCLKATAGLVLLSFASSAPVSPWRPPSLMAAAPQPLGFRFTTTMSNAQRETVSLERLIMPTTT